MLWRTRKPKVFLYRKNDYADEVYFISKGRVLFVYGPSNFTFKTMLEGSYFGEIELLD
jgi:CRP-like cAMP-binding protein